MTTAAPEPQNIAPAPSPTDLGDAIIPTAPQDAETEIEREDPADLAHVRKLRSENKNLRERAKTAEDQLGTLNAQVESFRRNEIERIAATVLADPKDLWLGEVTPNDFLGENGDIDHERVSAHVNDIAQQRPHWALENQQAAAPPSNRPVETLRPGATPTNYPREAPPTWSSVLNAGKIHSKDIQDR